MRQYRLCRTMIGFLRRQVEDIHRGGWPVLLRKIVALGATALAMPVVLAARILRPVVVIRFGPLISIRIGHFAPAPEVYLCERDAGMHGRRIFDTFYHIPPISNWQLKKMWDRTLRIWRFAARLDWLSRKMPGYKHHVIPMRRQGRDIHGLLALTSPHLSFTSEEERFGYASLRALGLPEGAPFVCFHARDAAYNDVVYPNKSWRYHDYRNSTIDHYLPAAEELTRRGYFAIRLGAVVEAELRTANPRIIDYARNGRTDFMDIFLGARCRFFLGDTAGISTIPLIFRRPIARANLIPLEWACPSWGPHDVFIPKKLWLRKERRFFTFREIFDSGAGRFLKTEHYEQLGIEVVENTPEEIRALIVEMDERLNGTWRTTEENKDLQRRFWSLFKASELHGTIRSHIGAEFLRTNRELVD